MVKGDELVMKMAVEMRNVIKKFGSKTALNQLSVSFPRGKVIGLLGENGAGKSTIFKLIMGFMEPNAGEITVFGKKPEWSNLTSISYLGDRSSWYKFHTVYQALQYANRVYPHFRLDQAQEYIKFMGLDMNAYVSDLSKGQEMRLQLLLCLARKVDLYLLDEPFSGIDLISREKIVELLIDIMSEREITMIISTHDLHEVEGLFEHVVFIKDGKVEKEGDVEKLRNVEGSIQSLYRRVYQ
jgi:ABC-2 type transport system ATP-binding protein